MKIRDIFSKNIERKMKKLLNELKIEYKMQYIVCGWIFDFYLPKYNLLIECDGDYWHGNLNKYPILTKKQKLRKKIDVIKNNIAKDNNFSLLRFWGSDILNDENNIKEEIMNVCI